MNESSENFLYFVLRNTCGPKAGMSDPHSRDSLLQNKMFAAKNTDTTCSVAKVARKVILPSMAPATA